MRRSLATPPTSSPPAGWPAGAILLSIALHATALAAALVAVSAMPGTVQEDSRAISLNNRVTAVIDVTLEADEAEAPPSEPPRTAEPVTEAPPPAAEPEPQAAAIPEPAETPPPPDPAPAPAPPQPETAPQPIPPPTKKPPPRPHRPAQRVRKPAVTAAMTAAAPLSASQGDTEDYGARVWAWIGRHPPDAATGQGRVMVSLTIGPDGGLLEAVVSQSSGDPTLDEAALSAIRRAAPYPSPPPGLAPERRRFVVPFAFAPR